MSGGQSEQGSLSTQVGQKWAGAVLLLLVALALRAALNFLLSLKGLSLLCCVRVFDYEMAPGGSDSLASDSQGSMLMLKSFRETFQLSFNQFLSPPSVRLPWQSSS